ncbi:MAG: glyceraldehyde-3-phosphate dehydrogenase [Haliea sp.]|jgi:glyceraldehyde 3-phosphate dehydrogenase|uniref:type I glyceraldehyde-3-phosphate dehydrogenase n=1 Tax=Haliea sp. TaxID=1932666 RepID=UPI000C58372F|nr:glyceraldehyde 3-phosphate dehydrogenase NAD-binding domain-containing protein [Haliea sp.]MBM68262.1 glyceraldehyde-3-phosphate dehydrogenase [Haliea sp.]|tara:strand:- start:22934 stop:23953 length:1020 start_codon:yes stop_codon:yes gene_type:complete
MTHARPIKVGLMGFGQIGRQVYDLAARGTDVEIVAIADIGDPAILHYLLCSEMKAASYRLEGNFLHNSRFRTRLLRTDTPAEMPWDVFGVDIVIDATGKFRQRDAMLQHLQAGAPRVLLRTLPSDHIDRLVMPGINGNSIRAADRMISAGSATTTALCLLLHALSAEFEIECGSMTTVHAYTSDQVLQDYAGSDFRRSRSAAENIIPNQHEAGAWLGHVLPALAGKVLTSALNVPIHQGCLLDVNLVFADTAVTADAVNDCMRRRVADYAGILTVVEDPVVSSDVIGNPHSLVFDACGTIKAGKHTIKALGWHETLGHAARLLDVARLYAALDHTEEAV